MKEKWLPVLSRAMLVVGVVLILGGLGWGIWTRLNAPPDPTFTEAGAVVLAETAPPRLTMVPAISTLTPTPSPTASPVMPTPELLPNWTLTETVSPPTPITEPPEPTPTPEPSRTPVPTPTPIPAAEKPPTRIVAETIELDAGIEPMGWEMVDHDGTLVSEWNVPEGAAGWHMNSAMPGHNENVVLSGHHNVKGKVFRYVVNLSMGDEITLYVDDQPYTYSVTDKYILKEAGMPLWTRKKNAQWIKPSGDERLTLVTCWPYEWPGNSHRVIIVARPPGYENPLFEMQE